MKSNRVVQYYFIFSLMIMGCGLDSGDGIAALSDKDKSINNRQVFAERDGNKDNFLFLDFWAGMNQEQFDLISDSLVATGVLSVKEGDVIFTIDVIEDEWASDKLDDIFNGIFNVYFSIHPSFKNNKLIRVTLRKYVDHHSWIPQTGIIELYKSRYNKYDKET